MSADERRELRRLAAIVVADVVGYSALMSADESGTLVRLRALRTGLLDPLLQRHGGRVVKLMGDGVLAEFASAVAATEWAVAVQRTLAASAEADALRLRIGVNVGDVLVDGDDLYGDGVNVAARLEPLAPRGGVCISAAVHDHVVGRVDTTFTPLGERALKNIARPVAVFAWAPDPQALANSVAAASGAAVPTTTTTTGPKGRKPTLAVRPFDVVGASEGATFLASAVHEAVLAGLSNLSGLTLLADAASADHAASGTIQAVGNRYRATVRLVDNRSGQQFWSERFDGDLSELFDAQDELAYRVSTALRFMIYDREVDEMDKLPAAERTDEMMLSRIGRIIAGSWRDEWAEAGRRLEAILAARPDDSGVLAIKSTWHLHEVMYGWKELAPEDAAASVGLARDAVRCNGKNDFAHAALSIAVLYADRDVERAAREAERSLELNPYYFVGRFALGLARVFGGRPEEGLASCLDAAGANPRLVLNHRVNQGAALGAFLLGRHEQAIDLAQRSDHQVPDVTPTLLILAAAAREAGLVSEMESARERVLRLHPDFSMATMRRWPFRHEADLARFRDALVAAGFPS